MNARALVVIFALVLACLSTAHAQENSAIVCGTALDSPGSLSWQSYVGKAENPTEKIDHTVLRELATRRTDGWPEVVSDVKVAVSGALEAFQNNALPAASVRLSKSGDLPPKQFGFFATPHQLELPLAAESSLCQDERAATARIEAAYIILLMERAKAAVIAEGIALTAKQISDLEARFDKYLFEGFPMFPWEAWVNGALLTPKEIAKGPPRSSIVLLHPAAGAVAGVDSDSRSDTAAVLSVEALGWIRYSRDYDTWYGASLLAIFPTDRNIGYGVAFNFNNYKLGVTYHDDDQSNHDGFAIFLGMDLLQFIDEKHRKYEGYKDKLDKALRSVGH
jgi:hypothetical protein